MADEAFEVELRKSKLVLTVPADKTILEVLLEHGVYVKMSCVNGVCGTCLTGVLEGEPDHRDEYQTDEEKEANDHMAVCVSRSRGGRIVLDL